MKDIVTLIKRRDESFKIQTAELMNEIEETLIGVQEFLKTTDPSFIDGTFVWEYIVDYTDGTDSVIMLSGLVTYDIGTIYVSQELDAEEIEITEDNQQYFDRDVRVGLPLEVVLMNDRLSVMEFLIDLDQDSMIIEDSPEHDLNLFDGEMFNDPTAMLKDFNITKIDISGLPEQGEDFDLDELTEEQLAYMLAAKDSDGTIN